MMLNRLFRTRVIPAKAGIQEAANWTLAFAGVTSYPVYFVELHQAAGTSKLKLALRSNYRISLRQRHV